jgi:hypothetical protein
VRGFFNKKGDFQMKYLLIISVLMTILNAKHVDFLQHRFLKEKKARYTIADKGIHLFNNFKKCTIKAKTRSSINNCELKLREELKKLNKTAKQAKLKYYKN